MAFNISLPQQTSIRDREVFAYLYRLADELRFALNELSSGLDTLRGGGKSGIDPSATYGAVRGLIAESDDIAQAHYEKIAEHGRAAGWTYIKWLGGIYEMFGTFDANIKSSGWSKSDTLYSTNAITLKTPFKISPDAVVTGTVSGLCWLGGSGYSDPDNIFITMISDKASEGTLLARLRVVGSYLSDADPINDTEEENGESN